MNTYSDESFVYVDPATRSVVGPVEWGKNGEPLAKAMPEKELPPKEDGPPSKARKRKPRKRNYPWGSYKTMKKIYHVEGKFKEEEKHEPFETVLQKALQDPYWS